jgi:hypothetical protein
VTTQLQLINISYQKYEPITNPKNEQVLTGTNSNIVRVLLVLKEHYYQRHNHQSENRMQLLTVNMMAGTERALGLPHQTLEENLASVIVRRF